MKVTIASKVGASHITYFPLYIELCLQKVFVVNLSAPRIPQKHGAELAQLIPYCDIIIGNEAEAEAWASVAKLPDKKDLRMTAKALAILPKLNASRPRLVILTNGSDPTILVSSADPDKPKWFPVDPLSKDKIVDTNGAGDAFAGGFLGALVSGKTVDESVQVGHKLGAMCIQQVCYLCNISKSECPNNVGTGRSPISMA